MARLRRLFLLVFAVVALAPAGSASAAQPPWCGTPETDAAASLPDGSSPSDPPGSFPHIPYYAIRCTLDDIAARSNGRMTVEVIGQSALGREQYGVVINDLGTRRQRRNYANWRDVRKVMLESPRRAMNRLARHGRRIKVPIYVQGGIHGNEYEGVDAAIDTIEKYATTPRGQNAVMDNIRAHAVLIFNPVQNPDGRVAGLRANGFGFDLNRDFLTQSQSETKASITLMKRWLPPEMLDLHGYVEPMLVEATTKPHNPSIEYDLWLKWNQRRIDYNEQAMDAIGFDITRPINDWCPEADPNPDGTCDNGVTPGPDVAEGWDDWGPFYGPMYMQHVGLDSSTVEMCAETDPPADAWYRPCGGRAGARRQQNVIQQSTYEFVVANRAAMLHDELEMYRRGDVDAPRPACCPPPFDPEFHNWMEDYPKAYVIPLGRGQRSDAEANRLVDWLLFNDIEVSELERDYTYNGQRLEKHSYVAWIAQPRRGLLDTAMGVGVDISDEISRLYAPPGAWSHGYLWGADVLTIPDGARFFPRTERIKRPNRLDGGVKKRKRATGYALEVDSPTAVRAVNELVRGGTEAWIATEASNAGPAGTVIFRASKGRVDDVGEDRGLTFRAVRGALPASERIEKAPRFAVMTSAGRIDQSTWVLRELGFDAEPVSLAMLNTAATDPLAVYDVLFNAVANYPAATDTAGQPINTVARSRLAAFFAGGGGYISGQEVGANFLAIGGQVAGLTAASDPGPDGGSGYSGIGLWSNTGGASSVITGAYPAQDTLIMDPPTWLTAVPATMTIDARFVTGDFFLSGLFPGNEASTAAGSAIIAHGTNTANTSRLVVFANNPLYRADPEREWPMVGTAAYWADN
jgi:hypothetical protein